MPRPIARAPVTECGALKRTRTSTPIRALAPEASASTNSAIRADVDGASYPSTLFMSTPTFGARRATCAGRDRLHRDPAARILEDPGSGNRFQGAWSGQPCGGDWVLLQLDRAEAPGPDDSAIHALPKHHGHSMGSGFKRLQLDERSSGGQDRHVACRLRACSGIRRSRGVRIAPATATLRKRTIGEGEQETACLTHRDACGNQCPRLKQMAIPVLLKAVEGSRRQDCLA